MMHIDDQVKYMSDIPQSDAVVSSTYLVIEDFPILYSHQTLAVCGA